VGHDAGTVDHFVGILAHHPVIAGQVRFALRTVEQQDFELLLVAEVQLDCRREGGTPMLRCRLGDAVVDLVRVAVNGSAIGAGSSATHPCHRVEDDSGLRQPEGCGAVTSVTVLCGPTVGACCDATPHPGCARSSGLS